MSEVTKKYIYGTLGDDTINTGEYTGLQIF